MQDNPSENLPEDISHAIETERHRQNAAIFRSQLEKEGLPLPVSRPGRKGSEPVLRILIAFVLLFLIGWSLFSGFGIKQFGLPTQDPGLNEVYHRVAALPEGAPVLVAVDYEPGFTGEMTAAALPVLDQLMLQKNPLVIVSTTPTGMGQAQLLLKEVARYGGHQPRAASNYLLLGFIPGADMGLSGFARDPRGILSGTLESKVAWLSPTLKSIYSVADFNLLVVITDRPDVAQDWIEQVGAYKAAPLIMVLSSQAAPQIQPYASMAPRQVDGIIAGLEGGTAYEDLLGRTGYARTFWAPLNVGLATSIGLILFGGIWSALQSTGKRPRRDSQASENEKR